MGYRVTTDTSPHLPMSDRIQLCLHERDTALGRTGTPGTAEDLFMFSSQFIHSAKLTVVRILYWQEVEEYQTDGGPYPDNAPPEHRPSLAGIPERCLGQFRRAMVSLIRLGYLHAFKDGVRAIHGYGDILAPMPQLWASECRDKPREIVGISLTSEGFGASGELATAQGVLQPWQIHRRIATDGDVFWAIKGRAEG